MLVKPHLHEKIIEMMKLYQHITGHNLYDLKTMESITFLKEKDKEYFIYRHEHKTCKYNLYIFNLFCWYANKNFFFTKEQKIYFNNFIKEILINDYYNIRYDLTLETIKSIYYTVFFDYMKSNGLLYLLSRIKPEDFIIRPGFYIGENGRKRAQEIYEEHMKLRWTWLGIIMKPDVIQICAIL